MIDIKQDEEMVAKVKNHQLDKRHRAPETQTGVKHVAMDAFRVLCMIVKTNPSTSTSQRMRTFTIEKFR